MNVEAGKSGGRVRLSSVTCTCHGFTSCLSATVCRNRCTCGSLPLRTLPLRRAYRHGAGAKERLRPKGRTTLDIYGIDFTSSPGSKKLITCQHCRLDGNDLHVREPTAWTEFAQLEEMLARPGPWIAGIEFPFGLPRRFVNDVDWPSAWQEYVLHAESLGKERFEAVLEDYKRARPEGQMEPRRRTDELAGALSPLKLQFQPVAKMFFQGAPRLVASGVAVPGLQEGDCNRTVVEAYPGVLARSVTKDAYKRDSPKEQTAEHQDARCRILNALTSGELKTRYGIAVVTDVAKCAELAEDPKGDRLDALLCAVQAAWAWINRDWLIGSPRIDPMEGWIADPQVFGPHQIQMRRQRSRPDDFGSSSFDPRADDEQTEGPNALQGEFIMLRKQAIQLRQTINTFKDLFESGSDTKRILEDSANLFFADLNTIMQEYIILFVCRLTGPAESFRKANLSTQRFTMLMHDNGCLTPEIKELDSRLREYGEILKPARDKLIAHSDWETHANPTILGQHEEERAVQFLDDLQAYFDVAGKAVGVGPLDFRNSSAPGDAIDLVKRLQRNE